MRIFRSRWALLAPVAMVMMLVAAACGGGGGATATPQPRPTATPAAQPTAAATPIPVPTATPTPALPKRGGILRTRIEFFPTTASHWNVIQGPINSAYPLFEPVLSSLVQLDMQSGNIVGDLAESWTFSPDAKRITFKIRPGVKWHDGGTFTAADAKWTFDVILNDTLGFKSHFKALLAAADSAVAVDATTLQLNLKQPSNSLFRTLAHALLLNYSPNVSQDQLTKGKVVGTNAFAWTRVEQDKKIEQRAFAGYWDKGADGKPLPYLDGIDWNVIKDSALHLAGFRTGQLDAFDHINATALTGQVDLIKKDIPGLITSETADSWRMILIKNKPPFTDIRVRKALQLGLDRDAFVQSALRGLGVPSGYVQVPKDFGGLWSASLAELQKIPGINPATKKQDIAQAEQLLQQAGYSASNPLKVTLTVVSGGTFADEAIAAATLLNAVKGFQIEVKAEESAVHNKRLVVPGGDFELIYRPFAQAFDDPSQTVGLFWTTKASRNYGEWSDPQVDAWYDEQETTPNAARRATLVNQIQERLYDQAYNIVLAWGSTPWVKRPDVKGLFLGGSFVNRGRYDKTWFDR